MRPLWCFKNICFYFSRTKCKFVFSVYIWRDSRHLRVITKFNWAEKQFRPFVQKKNNFVQEKKKRNKIATFKLINRNVVWRSPKTIFLVSNVLNRNLNKNQLKSLKNRIFWKKYIIIVPGNTNIPLAKTIKDYFFLSEDHVLKCT